MTKASNIDDTFREFYTNLYTSETDMEINSFHDESEST